MKILKLTFQVLIMAAIVVLTIIGIVKMPNRQCTSIKTIPHTKNESVLVEQKDIVRMLKKANINTIGTKLKEVDTKAINQLLSENPYIERVTFTDKTSPQLIIDYELKHIILHVYDKEGNQYFVDDKGTLLPYTVKMKDNLIIANGNISQPYKKGSTVKNELKHVYALAQSLLEDEFATAQFRQIYVNEKKELELVSTIGNQIVLMGDEENASEKLANLKQLYKNGLTRMGMDQYAMLDARYKNRIIAKRK